MDNRLDFIDTWLIEMPERIDTINLYDNITQIIKQRSKLDQVQDLGNNLKKIEGVQLVYYWYELNNIISIAVEFSKKPQSIVVNIIGKSPKFKGKPPFASDLYNAVLNDRKDNGVNSIQISSDTKLSDEGFNIWAKLLDQGHKISMYTSDAPGQSFITINTHDELKKYFNKDPSFKKYQYVITENKKMGETIGSFGTRRMRELSGTL